MLKKIFNLQRFAEAVSGKQYVYLYRVLADAATKAGTNLAFVTENGKTISADADSTTTKDGAIRTPGTPEIEITSTSIFSKGDETVKELEKACLGGKLMEIWEVDRSTKTSENKCDATYYQGYLTSFEVTANAEDFVEISLTFGINGKGATGKATLSAQQEAIADYVFQDTNKTGG